MALFDKLNKETLMEKAKQMSNMASALTQRATSSVTATYNQAQDKLEQKKEQYRLSKLPQDGGIKRYEVNYKGGLPGYPKEGDASRHPVIYMDVMPDRFSFLPKPKSESWFAGIDIPYCRVISLEIVERTVSTAETLVGTLRDNLDFHQKNVLELTYLGEDDEEYVMRSEMVTGVTTMGEARVCLELIDLLRSNKLMKQFLGKQEPEALPPAAPMIMANSNADVISQLKGYKELLDSGIITQEEFDAKKKQLLGL